MPTYTMVNNESGEEETMILSFSERDEWLEKNPEWTQKLVAPLLVREVKGALAKTPDSWKEHLRNVKKGTGRNSQIRT